MVELEIINDMVSFENLRNEWNKIFNNIESNNIFSTFDWCFTWWKYYGKNKELKIILLKEDGELIGIAPLMIGRGKVGFHSVKVVKFIGDELSDRNQFLFKKNFDQCMLRIIKYFDREKDGKILLFKEIDEKQTCSWIKDIEKNYIIKIKKGSNCPYMTLDDDFDKFNKRIGKQFKKNIKKRWRKLLILGNADILTLDNESQVKEFINNAAKIEGVSWKGEKKVGIFKSERDVKFHIELAIMLYKKRMLELVFLVHKGMKVSYRYGFKKDNYYFAYNSAFNPKYSEFSIGNQLRMLHIKKLINDGIDEYDYLRGEESYKFEWPVSSRFNQNWNLYKRSCLCSKYLFFIEEVLKPVIKKIIKRK